MQRMHALADYRQDSAMVSETHNLTPSVSLGAIYRTSASNNSSLTK